jgi:predicted nucleic acid-binding Zn ribbon protein
MPSYLYKCPKCDAQTSRFKKIEDRDDAPICVQHKQPLVMERVPTSANFTVTGFNAKNGYSK